MRKLSRSLTLFNSSSSISIGLSSGDLSTTNPDSPSTMGTEDEEDVPSSALPIISIDINDIKTKLNTLMSYFSIHSVSYTQEYISESEIRLQATCTMYILIICEY